MTSPETVHPESEAHPWTIDVGNHPARQDSPEYVAARSKMNQMAAQATGMIYGQGPFQDHHGGALWLQDSQGWFMVRNQAGVEWSAQFCAEPAKIDLLRQNAKRLYDLVAPQLKQQLDPDGLLDTPITDAAGVAKWTDSIFNAGVPLHPSFHTGVLPGDGAQPTVSAQAPSAAGAQAPSGDGAQPASAAAPTPSAAGAQPAAGAQASAAAGTPTTPAAANSQPAGVHHYPTPIVDIQLFKYDDFQLWVTDQQGNPAAVAPVDKRGSGNASVHVLYATPGSQLAQQKDAAERVGAPLILAPDHPLSVQAYQNQPSAGSGGTPGT
jgi:hypothetical protein